VPTSLHYCTTTPNTVRHPRLSTTTKGFFNRFEDVWILDGVRMQRELRPEDDALNVHGGAIALAHPLAATGVRLAITVARQLQEIGAALALRLRASAAAKALPCWSRTRPRPSGRQASDQQLASTATTWVEGVDQVLGEHFPLAAVVISGLYKQAVTRPLKSRQLEYLVLRLVCESPGSSAGDLAAALGVSRPRMSLIVGSLDRRGLIGRAVNLADRRSHRLHQTDAGRDLAGTAAGLLVSGERRLDSVLDGTERRELIRLLKRVAGSRRSGLVPA